MAVLKCNICGGEMDLSTDLSVGICQYCDSKIIIPKNLDRKGNLYNRAIFLRQNNEFDKAVLIYEDILKEDNADAEAHWGLALSKYGIEYVVDPISGERLPTCHRTQAASILADPDYLAALDNYDAVSAAVVEEQANQISIIQSKILEISRKEPPYDIFICYKETDKLGERTQDSIIAQDLYYELVKRGYKVFFARKTLESKLGSEYEPIIYAALNSARVMVVLGTEPDNFNAVWVRNEWSRFMKMSRDGKSEKIIIPAFKGMSPYELPSELSNFQSQDMSKIGFMQDLTDGVERCLRSKKVEKTEERPIVSGVVDMRARLIKNGETHLRLQNYEAAEKVYTNLVNDYPDEYRGWWGLISCKTKGLTDIYCELKDINVWYKYVCQLATPEELAEVEQEYMGYLEKVSVVEASREYEDIVRIVATYKEDIAQNQNTVNSYTKTLSVFKQQYNNQRIVDENNIANATKNLKISRSRLVRKYIFVGAFWGMHLLSIFLFVMSLVFKESASNDYVFYSSITLWLLSFGNLIISPKGSFKKYKAQIEEFNDYFDECIACKRKNKKTYKNTVEGYEDQIKAAKTNIYQLKLKITACNNYLSLGDERIAALCFGLKCNELGLRVSCDHNAKELRAMAYGYKPVEASKLNSNVHVEQSEEVVELVGNVESQPEQQYEVRCPNCKTSIIIGNRAYNQGYVYCGACGVKIEFQS